MHEWQTISMAGRGPSYDCTHMSVNIKVCAHTQAHGIRRDDVSIIIHSYYFFQCCSRAYTLLTCVLLLGRCCIHTQDFQRRHHGFKWTPAKQTCFAVN